MIANTFFAAGAFASLVAAIPMAQPPFPKRDIVWETEMHVETTVVPVTVTHWLEPGEAAPTEVSAQGYGQKHHGHHGHRGHHGHGYGRGGHNTAPAQPETTSTSVAAPPAYSPETSSAAPVQSSYVQPSSQQASTPVAPTTTSEVAPPAYTPSAAPEPTTTSQAAPPAYTPATSAAPAPQPSQSYGGSSGSNGLTGVCAAGTSYDGTATYYHPSAGLTSCGDTLTDSDMVVAIAPALLNPYDTGNPNTNPVCGQSITIKSSDGTSQTAKVRDTCPGCEKTQLDMSPSLFQKFGSLDLGVLDNLTWEFN